MARVRHSLIRVPVECGGKKLTALLDSGSEVSLITKVASKGIPHAVREADMTVVGMAGRTKTEGLMKNIPVLIGGQETDLGLCIVSGEGLSFEMLLGRDWIHTNLIISLEQEEGS
ncbi:hypothetical protein FRB94_002209 [Tulasnella sp. JGI-2019a]|nr:hypothetical protein FRB93_012612 [Tulasnella sp. JGI-2019a]KAG8987113.1 hypothetical protein FRB94_002209 [Tulasnella sp. JGI-2019a]